MNNPKPWLNLPPPIYRAARATYHGLQLAGRTVVHHTNLPWPYRARIQAARSGSDRRVVLIAPDRSFLYVAVPKAANSTIRRLLWRMRGDEVSDTEAMQVLHGGTGSYLGCADFSSAELQRLFRGPDAFKFTFVRNPYSRIASAYSQKIHGAHEHEDITLYLRNLGIRTTIPPTFEDFVNRIIKQPDDLANIHWMSQTRCAMTHLVTYDFIGKVETFDADFAEVLYRLKAPADTFDPTLSVNRNRGYIGDRGPYSPIYTEELADKVFKRYRRDFEAFSYSRHLEQT